MKTKTETLFLAIAGEAESCLARSDWEERLNNIVNIVTVIKSRIARFREERYDSELDKLVERCRKERGDSRVG